jgi:hypothetical protein
MNTFHGQLTVFLLYNAIAKIVPRIYNLFLVAKETMEPEEVIAKLQTMSIQEKLSLLSDTDKAYLMGYLDRAIIDIKPHLRTPLLKNLLEDNLKGGTESNE